jgi:hypothetical protein
LCASADTLLVIERQAAMLSPELAGSSEMGSADIGNLTWSEVKDLNIENWRC